MNWTSSGDLGDIVVALATAKHAAPKSTLLLRDDGRTKGIIKRKDLITPLVEAQTYIQSCRPYTEGDRVDWPSEQFRRGYHSSTDTLLNSHARHALAHGLIQTLPDSSQPWLTVPSVKPNGRVIVNRTGRYNNNAFPWQEVVDHYRDVITFVGAPNEHGHFQNCFGKVDYQPTKNMLEVAQLIAGSELFIGNQSSAMAIAEGLKHPRIQETCLHIPDCVYPGAHNAQYVAVKHVLLPPIGSIKGKLVEDGIVVRIKNHLPLRTVPRCGWVCPIGQQKFVENTIDRLAAKISKASGLTLEDSFKEVINYILRVDQAFFRRMAPTSHLTTVASALRSAGITTHPVYDALAGDIKFTF
jgi:hypothetical protein